MRDIKYIVVHCTATRQDATIEAIQNYWRTSLGWKNPGYHFLIDARGVIHPLQPIEKPSNGVGGHNAHSIHISYIGGVNAFGTAVDNRTVGQKSSILNLLTDLKAKFPKAIIQGHRDFPNVKKACPSFDAKKEYSWL